MSIIATQQFVDTLCQTILALPDDKQVQIMETIKTKITPDNGLPLIDVKTAARLSHVSEPTIKRWIKAGKIKNYSRGKKYLVNKNEVLKPSK